MIGPRAGRVTEVPGLHTAASLPYIADTWAGLIGGPCERMRDLAWIVVTVEPGTFARKAMAWGRADDSDAAMAWARLLARTGRDTRVYRFTTDTEGN